MLVGGAPLGTLPREAADRHHIGGSHGYGQQPLCPSSCDLAQPLGSHGVTTRLERCTCPLKAAAALAQPLGRHGVTTRLERCTCPLKAAAALKEFDAEAARPADRHMEATIAKLNWRANKERQVI